MSEVNYNTEDPLICPFCGKEQAVLWECQVQCQNGRSGLPHIDWRNAYWLKQIAIRDQQIEKLREAGEMLISDIDNFNTPRSSMGGYRKMKEILESTQQKELKEKQG